ncbi:MAG: hypothetical protein PHW73_11715 [Atribacterota bacterium]|nr:hypothetical protein [Atribacterota bacterium]
MKNRNPKIAEILDEKKLRIKCKVCSQVWIPDSLTDGRITQNSWQCSNGCKPKINQ